MKKLKSGFTLVEVSLFLVITAAVFVSVAVGTQNSIFQQRYNDSIQNFAEFLRTAYSQVTNVQNEGTGRSDKAIYGKLIVFREDEVSGGNKITSYNVIGGIGDIGSGRVLTQLESLGANVVIEKDGGGYSAVGFVEDYTPRWASQIQTTSGWKDDKYDIFTGAVLIVRHPKSGTVYTYKTKDSVDSDLMDIDGYLDDLNAGLTAESLLSGSLEDKFEMGDVDFCVNPNGADRSNLRKNIRIVAGARNASGVEIVPDGEDLVEVGGVSLNVGNRCEP